MSEMTPLLQRGATFVCFLLAAWGAGLAVGRLSQTYVMLLAVGAVAVAVLAAALALGLSLVEIYTALIVLGSATLDLPRMGGGVSGLALLTVVYVASGAVLWLMSLQHGLVGWGHVWPFVALLTLSATSMAWAGVNQRGIQNSMVFAAFILVIGIAAVHSYGKPSFSQRIDGFFKLAIAIVCGLYGLSVAMWGPGSGSTVGRFMTKPGIVSARPFSLLATLLLAWCLARWRYGSRFAFLQSIVLLTLIVLSLSRTAIVIALLMIPIIRMVSRHRLLALVRMVIMGVICALVFQALITHVGPLRERFTSGDVVSVGGTKVNVSGRATMWSAAWASFLESPITGKGAGSAEAALATALDRETQTHNDYLRLVHDYGLLAGVLWLIGCISLMSKTWTWCVQAEMRGRRREASVHLGAFGAILGVCLAMITDNPISYVFVMAPLGILIGVSIGERLRSVADIGAADVLAAGDDSQRARVPADSYGLA